LLALGQLSQQIAMAANTLDQWLERGEDDATWVLTSSFVILTMQSGFGLLESGYMPEEFTVNIMMKNAVDVIFGGAAYWLLGYGLSYGDSIGGFMGGNRFAVNTGVDLEKVDHSTLDEKSDYFSHYIFQFTFAATATTIVSGCVAGRMKFTAYCVSSFISIIIYCIAAHWVFHHDGWLNKLGAVDFAGDGPVHLLGAINGMVGTLMLGPRGNWREKKVRTTDGRGENVIFGLFLLWWGWLGFNCGSTFGITGSKWLVASRVAVTTITASIGGGLYSVAFTLWQHRADGHIIKHGVVVNGVLAGLVSVTSGCSGVNPAESLFIGAVGACLSELTNQGLYKAKVFDDPVGAFGVHGTAAVWGLVAAGLFVDNSLLGAAPESGLFHGGSFKVLAINLLSAVAIAVWTLITGFLQFKLIDLTIGLRATEEEERLGFDWSEHRVKKRHREELAQLKSEIEELQRWRDASGKLDEEDFTAYKKLLNGGNGPTVMDFPSESTVADTGCFNLKAPPGA